MTMTRLLIAIECACRIEKIVPEPWVDHGEFYLEFYHFWGTTFWPEDKKKIGPGGGLASFKQGGPLRP
jgi:hypothetical protein